MLDLVHRALARVFVGAPAKKFCAVSKPAASEMVVRDFHGNFGRDWFPLASPLGAPAAWPSGRVPGEPGRFFQCFKFLRYRPAFRSFESGNKSDVMEQTIFSVETEQKRTDYALASRITKSRPHNRLCGFASP